MHDIAIRNGRIIDGTGAPEFRGDIAIDGAVITSVNGGVGKARREIDAEGKLVVPGWIDIHTHFDAQVSWDPYLTPSCWNGGDDDRHGQLRGRLRAGQAEGPGLVARPDGRG